MPVRAVPVYAWRGLLLAGLGIAGWAVVRVVLLLTGEDWVIGDGDPHGYAAIFSLVFVPVLGLAVATLAAATAEVWRHGRTRRVAPGVTLALSALLAHPLTVPALVVGGAIVIAALADRRVP